MSKPFYFALTDSYHDPTQETWFGDLVSPPWGFCLPLLLVVGVANRSASTFTPKHLVLIMSVVPACTPAPTQPIYLQHKRLQLLHCSLPGCCLIYCGLKGSVTKDSDLESCHRPVSPLSTTTQATCSPLPQQLPSPHPLTALWISVFVPSLPFSSSQTMLNPGNLASASVSCV